MTPQLPQRPRAHQLEDESENFFRQSLPHGWTCDRPQNDYGVDLRVGLANDGYINGQQLVVQLKASEKADSPDFVVIRLEVATLQLLRQVLDVAVLVKYVAAERKAYWLLLKDFTTQPKRGQKTIKIRIPKENRISAEAWNAVAYHVQAVHDRKLNSNLPGHPR
ncbi:DUF4365 domain-containing protein [Pseudoxanthomonas japonensis]|nr:DUF4365 domain-containing protein [Pseudoxanthomonas japonensis]